MSEWVQVAILAVVQGIAEFLPISSSGHLVLIEEAIGVKEGRTELNVLLHGGTLLSILIVYRDRIWSLLAHDRASILSLFLAMIPTGIIGLIIKYQFGSLLEDPLLTGFMLLFTAGFLLVADRWRMSEDEEQEATQRVRLSWPRALLVGTVQGIAALPGISRSGATITAGVLLGLSKREAATFSFLLAIPTICAAATLETAELLFEEPSTDGGHAAALTPGLLLFGTAISFVVGLAALSWLRRYLEHGTLKWFAAWCAAMGIVVIVWQGTMAFDGSEDRETVPAATASEAAGATEHVAGTEG